MRMQEYFIGYDFVFNLIIHFILPETWRHVHFSLNTGHFKGTFKLYKIDYPDVHRLILGLLFIHTPFPPKRF